MSKQLYKVVLDDDEPREGHIEIRKDSLAALVNHLKINMPCAARYRVWSESGVQLIDTKFGDSYDLLAKQSVLKAMEAFINDEPQDMFVSTPS